MIWNCQLVHRFKKTTLSFRRDLALISSYLEGVRGDDRCPPKKKMKLPDVRGSWWPRVITPVTQSTRENFDSHLWLDWAQISVSSACLPGMSRKIAEFFLWCVCAAHTLIHSILECLVFPSLGYSRHIFVSTCTWLREQKRKENRLFLKYMYSLLTKRGEFLTIISMHIGIIILITRFVIYIYYV